MTKSLKNKNYEQMTPGEFARLMSFLGWSQHFLARELSCTSVLVWRWSMGDLRIPPEPAAYLRTMARAKERIHVPRGWQARPGVKAASLPSGKSPAASHNGVKLVPVSTAPAIPHSAARALMRAPQTGRTTAPASKAPNYPRQTL